MESKSEILLYQSEDKKIKIEVRLDNNTVWLTQSDMVELFQSSKSNISEHIKHIFEEGELPQMANHITEVEKHFIATIEQTNKKLKSKKQ